MASKAFSNALKLGSIEHLADTVEFDLDADTQTFDLGDYDLSDPNVRVEIYLNGNMLEDGDWSVNADDNTAVDMVETIPAGNEINFKIYTK